MRTDQLSEVQSSGILMPSSGAPRVSHLPEARTAPVPEVSEKAERRQFTAKYKLRVLQELDRCSEPGQVGALLRREGLYSSHLSKWRAQREAGLLQALAPKKRGHKPAERPRALIWGGISPCRSEIVGRGQRLSSQRCRRSVLGHRERGRTDPLCANIS